VELNKTSTLSTDSPITFGRNGRPDLVRGQAVKAPVQQGNGRPLSLKGVSETHIACSSRAAWAARAVLALRAFWRADVAGAVEVGRRGSALCFPPRAPA